MTDIRPELVEGATLALINDRRERNGLSRLDRLPWAGTTEAEKRHMRAGLEAVADDLRAEGAADDREQWARKVAQELATTSVQSAQYIGQMVTGTLDALLAMTRASVLAEAKAEALREAADAMDADPEIRDPLHIRSSWLRNRADQIAGADQYEQAWQSRDWDTVRHLQDEAEQ